jgi:hypothetical protein
LLIKTGNARSTLVATVNASAKFISETKSTLQFASRAKLVQSKATVNVDVLESDLIEKLAQFKEKLAQDEATIGEMKDKIKLLESCLEVFTNVN